MTERTKAWQCIGCGRIESQATCLGICQDRPVHVVSAADYAAGRKLGAQLQSAAGARAARPRRT
jgi:hypothetical protein